MSMEKYLKFYSLLHIVFKILEFGGEFILLTQNSCNEAVTTCFMMLHSNFAYIALCFICFIYIYIYIYIYIS